MKKIFVKQAEEPQFRSIEVNCAGSLDHCSIAVRRQHDQVNVQRKAFYG